LRQQVRIAHDILEATMADVTPEQAHWAPPGIANPLGATYAHVVVSEDFVINGMFRHQAPLNTTTSADRTGLSQPMPAPASAAWSAYPAWTRQVRVDLDNLREYAHAVHAETDGYLASLSDADREQPLDLSDIGLGPQTVASTLTLLLLNHIGTETGEIACLKGLQGARGYPFQRPDDTPVRVRCGSGWTRASRGRGEGLQVVLDSLSAQRMRRMGRYGVTRRATARVVTFMRAH
jgi:DinB superfamily